MEQKAKNVSPFSNEARNAYVLSHVTESVLRLLCDKPLHEISISEICNDAGIGRTSFYRNFETREDVVRKHVRSMLSAWEEAYLPEEDGSNAKRFGSFFQHLKDHSDLFLLLKDRGLLHLFLEAYMEIYGPQPEDNNTAAYTKAFIAYGTYSWIEEWISRGMQESAEDMTSLLLLHGMS